MAPGYLPRNGNYNNDDHNSRFGLCNIVASPGRRAGRRAIGVNIVASRGGVDREGEPRDLGLHSSETVPLSPHVLVMFGNVSPGSRKYCALSKSGERFSRRKHSTCIMQRIACSISRSVIGEKCLSQSCRV